MVGWGVLGCGAITDRRGAPAIAAQSLSRLVSLHSRTASRAEELARRHGAARWTASRDELLADPEVTAVYVATEHHRHHEDVLAAAAAGKHVLCEKPLALTVADGEAMIAACRAAGVALQVAYYRRYYPKLMLMKELLEQGVIGEPVTASIHLAGRVEPQRATAAASEPYGEGWRLRRAEGGGGALVDTGSHRLDLLCWLLGEPERVAALVERRELAVPADVPDMETLLLRMRSGAHVVSRHGMRSPSADELVVTGTRGTLSATPVDGPQLELHAGGRTERWELPRHENVHFPLFDDFARRIAVGMPPQFTGEEGLAATRIIAGAYASAAGGRFVEV